MAFDVRCKVCGENESTHVETEESCGNYNPEDYLMIPKPKQKQICPHCKKGINNSVIK